MKRAILTAAVVFCGLAAVPRAQAEEEWFIRGPGCEPYASATLMIVTNRVKDRELTTEDSTDPTFPGGTYYPYFVMTIGPDGGLTSHDFAWFKSDKIKPGAYDINVCTGTFLVDDGIPETEDWPATGFMSWHASEPLGN